MAIHPKNEYDYLVETFRRVEMNLFLIGNYITFNFKIVSKRKI